MPDILALAKARFGQPAADRPGKLTERGLTVLLVYGAEIKTARAGEPGIRVTAGYHDGTVLLEAVGFDTEPEAHTAIAEAAQACMAAGLRVDFAPRRMSNHPARVISRGAR